MNHITTTSAKPPMKVETALRAFIELGALNTFEANRIYDDSCLHKIVSCIQRQNGIQFARRDKTIRNRTGGKTRCRRYWLPEPERPKAWEVIRTLAARRRG